MWSKIEKELLGQSQRAVLVVVYYRMLEMSIPDSFPGKKELMAHKALNGSDLRKSREILSLLLIEKSEHAYAWQQAFSFCDELIKSMDSEIVSADEICVICIGVRCNVASAVNVTLHQLSM